MSITLAVERTAFPGSLSSNGEIGPIVEIVEKLSGINGELSEQRRSFTTDPLD